MSKLKKCFSILLCVGSGFLAMFNLTSCDKKDTGGTIEITDMLGEKVTVKKNPTRVACASRTTYDLLIAFGVADSIDGVYYSLLDNEWASVFDKNAGSRYSLAYQENYETYISRNVDIVFSPEKYISDGLKEHGIKAINVSLYGNPDYSGYVYYFADLVKQIWDSKEVADRVDLWKSKMAGTINNIQTELAKHNEESRTIYYVRGDKNKGIGYTESKGSFTEYAYRVLGMTPLNDRFSSTKPSKEEICAQNPDVFVVGGIYQKTLINSLQEEPYVNLDAVKNNQVFNIPIGLTMFEQLSVFSPVFFCDQANKLYPSYFDFDTKKQIQDLSLEFFGVTISDVEAENMLNGLSRGGNPLV